MRQLLLACVVILAGCATEEKFVARLNTHIGQTEDQLIQSIGRAPDRAYDTGSNRYVEYAVQWTAGGYTYTVPQTTYNNGMVSGYGGSALYNGTSTTYVQQTAPTYQMGCAVTYTITGGHVASYSYRGNACVSE